MTWIASVRFVRVPFRVPFVTAAGTWDARESWLLRISHDDGRMGWGEAVLEDPGDAPVLEALLDDLVDTGLPPSPALVGRAGPAGRAFRAALDAARLDVLAATPEARAAVRPVIGVNATIGAGETAVTVAAALAAVTAGFRTLKLKAGATDTTALLVDRLGAVRSAVGDAVALRLDVNGSWSFALAVERLDALRGVGLQYVEQPLDPADVAGAAALRARVGMPLAADEAVASATAARALLDAGAADVLVVKPARVGGPVVVGEIALVAASRGVPVVISSLFETGVGLAGALASAAALPDVPAWPAAERDHGLATADLLVDDLLLEGFFIEGGRMRAPFGPGSDGFGVAVDEAAVARYEGDEP